MFGAAVVEEGVTRWGGRWAAAVGCILVLKRVKLQETSQNRHGKWMYSSVWSTHSALNGCPLMCAVRLEPAPCQDPEANDQAFKGKIRQYYMN